ncbi:nineteen complex-related protein 2-domain-containing protein [Xylaria bambusicola]|uniref:nineteen complex-related protein 2-domain-containing protein n=1 Tax=Xylaria bambusicola TaxID=326684 RepID=UPI0020083212|nr:nineteen complex-related protein 2-domain-containing protein [Xylaria bambusicola]KAI0517164.1 nineteen complex-related protein 2-domain-containing protein [Xylaria bambusicola]
MSSFASKRKGRKITVQDDEETPSIESLNPTPEPQEPALQPTFKSRKPFKQSSLRKSININDEASKEDTNTSNIAGESEDQEDGGAPVRTQPSTSRPGLAKSKKRQSSSRLSFGPSETAADDDDSMVLGGEVFTPKKPGLAASAAENSAYKKGISKNLPLNRLPMRSMEDDDDRPRYSKEYLSELQSSTPNAPQDLSKLQIVDDEMSLDPSELEGAMIVEETPSTSLTTNPSTTAAPAVLTEAEIREKKERRSRLAKQKGNRDTEDFISLSDDENDERRAGDSYLTLLSRKSNTKSDTRLVAEDEDLGEGFDEFVEDGGLSLGRKAEREARKRHHAEMASLISAAEGAGSDGEAASDDSEAERRAAFEAAQTRAGMDGLAEERAQQRKRLGVREGVVPVPPKITPLPDLSVLAEEFQARMRQKEAGLIRMRAHIAQIKTEREDVLKRQPEVQTLLNEAGERYRALMMPGAGPTENGQADGEMQAGSNGIGNGDSTITAARTLLDQFRDGPGTPGERGLESLGTTPVKQTQME